MSKIILILLLIIPNIALAKVYSSEEWISIYIKPCPKPLKNGIQCFDRTRSMLQSLSNHRKMIIKKLNKYRLPLWLGTIPVIESGMGYKAVSESGAIGLWQIMPLNLIFYMTTKRSMLNYVWIRKPKLRYAISQGKKPKVSTEIACKILKHLYKKYRKDRRVKSKDLDRVVVMAYNAGETRIDKWLSGKYELKPETMNYFFQLQAIQELLKDLQNGNSFGLR